MQGKCRFILRNRFVIITKMIVQNSTFTANFVPIERFDGWSVSLGNAEKKKSVEARSRGQCRANAELSFQIGSSLSLQ